MVFDEIKRLCAFDKYTTQRNFLGPHVHFDMESPCINPLQISKHHERENFTFPSPHNI